MISFDQICHDAVEGRSEFCRAGAARFPTAQSTNPVSVDQHARFRKFRRDRRWSQVRMASEFGVSQPSVHRWEAGDPIPLLAVKLLDRYEAVGYGLKQAAVVPSASAFLEAAE